jgi:hypothetical protein
MDFAKLVWLLNQRCLYFTNIDKLKIEDPFEGSCQPSELLKTAPEEIAKDFARQHSKEYKQFLYVSLGSCSELETQLILSNKRNYLTKSNLEELAEDINHESRMIVSLISKI